MAEDWRDSQQVSPATDAHSDADGTAAAAEFHRLVERVRQGDATAIETLVDKYQGLVRREIRFALLDRRLRRVVGDSDVCQSVLMRLFVGLWAGKYDIQHPAQLAGLLKAMVRNRVADLSRRWHSQRRDLRRQTALANESLAGGPDDRPSPSQMVADRELLQHVRNRLSAEEQTIVQMRQEGLAWEEVAREWGDGRGPEALRKQYERALARIFKDLEGED